MRPVFGMFLTLIFSAWCCLNLRKTTGAMKRGRSGLENSVYPWAAHSLHRVHTSTAFGGMKDVYTHLFRRLGTLELTDEGFQFGGVSTLQRCANFGITNVLPKT